MSSILVLLLVCIFLFALIRIAPGSPNQKYLSPKFNSALIEKIKISQGLDQPLFNQFYNFVQNLLVGDLGISFEHNRPVLDVISEYLPITITLAILTVIVSLCIALLFALINMYFASPRLTEFITRISLVLYNTPTFVIGVFLIYLLSYQIKIFPSSGLNSFEAHNYSFINYYLDRFHHLILPVITLSVTVFPVYYKYLIGRLEELKHSTFVLYLTSIGTPQQEINMKHILPNAVNPLIAIIGIDLGNLLSGTLITEVIFGLPGLGRLTLNGIFARDYPLIIGCVLIAGLLILISNFIADLVRSQIDPRLSEGLMN
ncbi:MAG: ABC transporter permease [Bacteroidetes bacterium]|nr:ABC transporter permease [Bacteroidota bacterium]